MSKSYQFNPFTGNFDETVAGAASTTGYNIFSVPQTLKSLNTADTIGSELITNAADRDMSGPNNWSGTNWTVGGGVLSHTAGSAANAVLAGYASTIGKWYTVTFKMTTTVPTTDQSYVAYGNDVIFLAVDAATVGLTKTYVGVVKSTSGGLLIHMGSSWEGYFDDFSIFELSPATAVLNITNSSDLLTASFRAHTTGTLGVGANSLLHNIGSNTAFGLNSAQRTVGGTRNSAFGDSALYYNVNGNDNDAFGLYALQNNLGGSFNVAFGGSAGRQNINGSYNTAIGNSAGGGSTIKSYISNTVSIGYKAGAYNLLSNKLYIDAFDRTNTAGDDAGAIITGTMSATPANQTLKFNAAVTSGISHSSPIFNVTNGVQKSAITRSATAADYALALPDSSGTFALIDAAQTFTALQTFSGGIGSTAGMTTINGYTRLLSPTQSAVAAGDITFDASAKHIFYATGGTGTWTVSNLSEGQTVTIVSTAVTGVITWATATLWPGATVPTPTPTTANRYDIYSFTKIGGLVFGSVLQNMG